MVKSLCGLGVAAAAVGVGLWLFPRRDPYRYPYTLGRPLDTRPAIAFLEKRAANRRQNWTELAELASLHAAEARWTGDEARYDQAEALARRSFGAQPNAAAATALATVAEARHDFEEALKWAGRALRLDPGFSGARVALVTSHLARGEHAEAAAAAETLVRDLPVSAHLALRALALEAAGKDAEARRDFEGALRVEDFGAYRESAWIRALFGRHLSWRGKHREAVALLEEALRISPEYPFALYELGAVFERAGRTRKALAAYERALLASPQPRYLGAVARLKRSSALRDEAIRMVRADLARGRYGHRLDLAELLLEAGGERNAREALALVREELRARPGREVWYLLARAQLIVQLGLARYGNDASGAS